MSAEVWVGVAGGAAVGLILITWLRARRQTIRRVAAVVARLDERPSGVEGRGGSLESALTRLERTADRANTRLADSRIEHDRMTAALDALDHGVVVVNDTGRVVLRNAAAAAFVDARHGDALAESAIRDLLASAVRGVAGVRELDLFGPPRRSLEVHALPLADAGGASGAAAFIRDVSAVRRVDAVRRDFVANVSHELKTPIGALIALAETLEVDDDAEVMKRLAGRVLREAERLGRIVDDLLDLSVLEVQAAPDRSAAPIADLISEAVDRVAPAARAAGAELTIAEVSDGAVVCDRRQIVSALCNLLENGLKYLDDAQGAVRAVTIGASRDGADVVFHVTDTGIGIPESDRERIFERFYRVDRARSRQTGGTGLGLAIVRHVAQVHGGLAQVRSEEGVGSTFFLVIPSGLSEGPPMEDARTDAGPEDGPIEDGPR